MVYTTKFIKTKFKLFLNCRVKMVSADQETIYSDQNPFKIFSSSYSSLPSNPQLLQSAVKPAETAQHKAAAATKPYNQQLSRTNLFKSAIRPFTSAIPKLSHGKQTAKTSTLPTLKTSEEPGLGSSTLPTYLLSYQKKEVDF